jgi:hypothetical protein
MPGASLACVALLLLLTSVALDASPQDDTPAVECDDPSCKRERERLEKETPSRTSFLDRVHLDVLGAPPEIGGGANLVGVVGAHLTIVEFGRINLFGPPGVMLAMASADGEPPGRWRPMTALSWGISVRLLEFRVRGSARKTVMYLNLTKLWTWGDFTKGTDFAGLSFAWKRDPNQARVDPRWRRSTNRTSSATEPTDSFDMTRPR